MVAVVLAALLAAEVWDSLPSLLWLRFVGLFVAAAVWAAEWAGRDANGRRREPGVL